MSAYLAADLSGWQSVLFWLGLGIPLAAVVVVALAKLADWSVTKWPGNDEPARDPRARFESMILALVLMGLPVIALTR